MLQELSQVTIGLNLSKLDKQKSPMKLTCIHLSFKSDGDLLNDNMTKGYQHVCFTGDVPAPEKHNIYGGDDSYFFIVCSVAEMMPVPGSSILQLL